MASHLGVHFRLEEPKETSALRLGAVECEVSVFEEVVRVLAIDRRHGDADAGADRDLIAFDLIGGAQLRDHPLGQYGRLYRMTIAGLDDREFIAA